jgi:hypothetical protein
VKLIGPGRAAIPAINTTELQMMGA